MNSNVKNNAIRFLLFYFIVLSVGCCNRELRDQYTLIIYDQSYVGVFPPEYAMSVQEDDERDADFEIQSNCLSVYSIPLASPQDIAFFLKILSSPQGESLGAERQHLWIGPVWTFSLYKNGIKMKNELELANAYSKKHHKFYFYDTEATQFPLGMLMAERDDRLKSSFTNDAIFDRLLPFLKQFRPDFYEFIRQQEEQEKESQLQ